MYGAEGVYTYNISIVDTDQPLRARVSGARSSSVSSSVSLLFPSPACDGGHQQARQQRRQPPPPCATNPAQSANHPGASGVSATDARLALVLLRPAEEPRRERAVPPGLLAPELPDRQGILCTALSSLEQFSTTQCS